MTYSAAAPLPNFASAHGPVRAVFGWLLGAQRYRIFLLVFLYCLFFGAQILVPYLVGQALQSGIGDGRGLTGWVVALAGVIAVVTLSGYGAWTVLELARMDGIIRTERAVLQQIMRLGGEIGRRFSTGDIVSITSADAVTFGYLISYIGMLGGSLFSYGVAVTLLATQAADLALTVLLGMPVMLLCLRPTFRALETRKSAQRAGIATANTLAGDTVTGLRVLRGLGGEEYFAGRYRTASRDLRRDGEAVARSRAVLEGAQVLLPGILLLVVVLWSTHKAVAGDIAPGVFIAFYGYLTLLVRPLRTTIMGINHFAHARVAARRIHGFLTAQPPARARGTATLRRQGELRDPETGLTFVSGRLTALVDESPERATAVLDRLARHTEPAGQLAGVPLTEIAMEEVRAHIHLLHHDAHLFSGDLHDQLDVDGRRTAEEIVRALHTASALDIVGLDPSHVDHDPPPGRTYETRVHLGERGRGLSGGQVQRLLLARALLAGGDILLLDRPTTAVDARTEARISARLASHRAGRTTVVATSSPQLLADADEVVFHGAEVLRGTHAELLRHRPYRDCVRR
ncbi:ABC transporter ATP-binding protein [Nonomuraea sp. MG754425]|uniref:ABC transporter transmembrane domain-containing protein n=1 Tax=Nonomuraea sp. MG754425 TaxID=2570319 RepID=UPI00235124CF|nr:ABC transporter ATP-binding protein [Nonomuraea sp. MG754425]MCF6472492.1 ABC transporter ATP-binding protein [Nonomuraea sp. MG754425]